VLESRENKNETHYNEAIDNRAMLWTLNNCGLYKFWPIQGMKAQV